MTRSTDDEFYDTLAAITIDILAWLVKAAFNVIWVALAIPMALVVKSLQTSPEDQLRAPEQPANWGEEIEYVVCRRCTTQNEKGSAWCCVCGVSLGPTVAAQSGDSARSIKFLTGILVLTILVTLVSMVLLGIF